MDMVSSIYLGYVRIEGFGGEGRAGLKRDKVYLHYTCLDRIMEGRGGLSGYKWTIMILIFLSNCCFGGLYCNFVPHPSLCLPIPLLLEGWKSQLFEGYGGRTYPSKSLGTTLTKKLLSISGWLQEFWCDLMVYFFLLILIF